MKLPWPLVTTAGGALDPVAVQENLDALARASTGTGGQQLEMRSGTGTWTWPGAQQSSSVTTINHGLGRVPVVVIAQNNQDQGANEVIDGYAFAYTDTSFGTRGSSKIHTNYPAASTATFVWFAIG